MHLADVFDLLGSSHFGGGDRYVNQDAGRLIQIDQGLFQILSTIALVLLKSVLEGD